MPAIRPHALLVALPLLLGACTPPEALWTPEQNPKTVAVERAARTVVLPPVRGPLSAADTAQLRRLVEELGAPGAIRITVTPPAGADRWNPAPVVTALARLGVDPANIALAAPPAAGTRAGGVTVSGEAYAAIPPRCPDWSRSRIEDGTHQPSSNLGCANANNLAHMLADPGDLSAPRRLGPGSGPALTGAVERYETNKVTPLQPNTTVLGGAGSQ